MDLAQQAVEKQPAGRAMHLPQASRSLLGAPMTARQIAQAQKAKQFEQYGKTALLPYCG
ncbi:MAG: hypothetical protein PVG03_18730 [Desulfarculaceae bacterium]